MAGILETVGLSWVYQPIREALRWISGRKLRSNRLQIERQEKWKPLVGSHLREIRRDRLSHRIIIRDVKRLKEYPSVGEHTGISPWFRTEMIGIYHRGIEVALNIHSIVWEESEGCWRIADEGEREGATKGWVIGYIPWEYVEYIDFHGDEYYSHPHIVCNFAHKGEPYEAKAFCERGELNGWDYFTELATYDDVKKTSEKFDTAKHVWRSPYRAED